VDKAYLPSDGNVEDFIDNVFVPPGKGKSVVAIGKKEIRLDEVENEVQKHRSANTLT
jgi:hypothetical protein